MKAHLIGIGGYGMKILAFFMKGKGYEVSGSDLFQTETLEFLKNENINVWSPHDANLIAKVNPDIVVYSLAINSSNEELVWSRKNNKEIFTRGRMLAKLLPQKNSVLITGTDGKTTTTSMVAEIFYSNNKEYNLYVGGDTPYFNKNIIYDNNYTFISEIDESDPDFKFFSSEVATVTNLNFDHLENYNNNRLNQLNSFKQFLNNSKFKIINEQLKDIFPSYKNLYTFSLGPEGDLHIEDPLFYNFSSEFTVVFKDSKLKVKLNVPYLHNIEDSLAAALSAYHMGIPIKDSYESLYYYKGVKRRFEIKFKDEKKNIYVIDDYAHNPHEVVNTVKAAKVSNLKLITIFQPHRYSRFKAHWKEFADSLLQSDVIIITDVFGAYENEDSTVTPNNLKDLLIQKGKIAHYIEDFDKILSFVQRMVDKNTVILTLGAGDITKLSDKIVKLYV